MFRSRIAYVIPLLTTVALSRFLEHHVSVGYLLGNTGNSKFTEEAEFVKSLHQLLEILEAILTHLPRFCDKCQAVLIILGTTAEELQSKKTSDATPLLSKTAVLKKQSTDLRPQLSDISSSNTQRKVGVSCHQALEKVLPPNDFRQLPVGPTNDDVHIDCEPFIRANKDKGRYDDLDHYLDVQFRLLREDYVRPMREGLAKYLENVRAGTSGGKLTELRRYGGVRLIQHICTPDGVGYRIRLDMTELKHVRWQSSKRLLYGSLLCLSHDNFQTLVFATVIGRRIGDLYKGLLEIRFLDQSILQEVDQREYIMVESTAFFEAYRHVLAGLQKNYRGNAV